MSLYDDEDLGAPLPEVAKGWSTGIKMMQSHLQAKKLTPTSMGPPKSGFKDPITKHRTFSAPVLAPVIDLKSKKHIVDDPLTKSESRGSSKRNSATPGIQSFNEPSFEVTNEYDPRWPNEYHKVTLEMRGDKNKDEDSEFSDSKKRKYTEDGRAKARERFSRDESGGGGRDPDEQLAAPPTPGGFGRRPKDDYEDEDEEEGDRRRKLASTRRTSGSTSGGAAIAPPPSLTETTASPPPPSTGSPTPPGSIPGATTAATIKSPLAAMMKKGSSPGLGIAAKIMAKYGYKQGLGLGRNEQGMSQALVVEKTSRRGGKIIHEKDLMPPPMFGESFKSNPQESTTPPHLDDTDEYGDPIKYDQENPQNTTEEDSAAQNDNKPSITDLMRNPSKVVLCQNMVGPGEVDDDLEPEIQEECNTKYGDVQKVVIFEIPNAEPEKAVRIFTEFKRVESAIKAVVDLNGRFFGGREVQASFYDVEKFKNLNLAE